MRHSHIASLWRKAAMSPKPVLITFFSVAGRTSVLRLVVIAVLIAAVLWACAQTTWEYGRVINGFIGAVAGAAIAKLVVEAIRRLRDAGISLRFASWCALALGLAAIGVFSSYFLVDLESAQTMLSILTYASIMFVAVGLLWPSRASSTQTQARGMESRGLTFAVACVIGGAIVAALLASLSIGMDEVNQRAMTEQARSHWQEARP